MTGFTKGPELSLVERLRALVNCNQHYTEHYCPNCDRSIDGEMLREAADALAEQAVVREELCGALRPFARIADGYNPKTVCEGGVTLTYPDDESIVLLCGGDFNPDAFNATLEGVTFDEITAGDLRRARAALAKAAPEKETETETK